ncbi:tail fiber protein [Flavobacterium sp. N1736]|uniref:tail fiber protein n=1 Tax=Flavobacterium sp. N1736 TaxID=2986823 RepID=UPI002223F5AF|nr:tail fiber protein [Flavobacterium sp. N1736]
MKKTILFTFLVCFSFTALLANSSKNYTSSSLNVTEYETSVTFPAGYVIGDYIEFLKVAPISASASGYYQISISYTRNSIASGATHLASISHANPAIWRETGRINNNPYVGTMLNFTVDCNTEYANPRFRIRAINTFGTTTSSLTVYIKVTSININSTYTASNITGNDLTVSRFLPMTSDWDLYVGDVFTANGASLAIKAIQNGNVGIGTAIPDEKLTVKGKIHTQEVRVDMLGPLVPDYVFTEDYKLKTLQEVEEFIKQNKHLPEIPSAQEIEKNGLMLAEMNMSLLKKMEEMTLYMIEQNKKINELEQQNKKFADLENRLAKIENNSK